MTYDELDAAIVTAISRGADKFVAINACVRKLAEPHSLRADPFRVVDRRLQWLRKRNVIRYWRGKWCMPELPNG